MKKKLKVFISILTKSWNEEMKIQFIGAIDDVTGSMSLISNSKGKILIDCGMYQGEADAVKKNKRPLPFKASEIDAIILTHAHYDHSGFIPKLIKDGFRGSIYSTRPTMKLARIIMLDSAKLLQHENNPLHGVYELEDAVKASSFFKVKEFLEQFEVIGMKIHFIPAGHILGAASVVIEGTKKVVFSGDLGRFNDSIVKGPDLCPETDVLVIESTYGGKIRRGTIEEDLKKFLTTVKDNSKVGIVASFAVARSQLLLTLISQYFVEHPEQKVRVVIDSPMMVEANKVYREFADKTKCPLLVKDVLSEVEVIDQEREWLSIQKQEGPLIILSSSGMVSGGRIWRYLENWQQDPNALLFLPGYQGKGTPGRALSEGKKNISNTDGKKIHWHGEVLTSEAFSSHADQNELIEWLKNIKKETFIYLNHGEEESKEEFKKHLNKNGYKNVFIAGEDILELLH